MTGEEWRSKLPDRFTWKQGRDAADQALTDARAIVRAVAFSYHGTIPPPPWPAPAELQAAQARVVKLRDGFDVFVRRNVSGPVHVKLGPVLRAAGVELYRQAAELQAKQAAAPRLPDLLKLIPDPRLLLAGFPIFAVLLAWIYFSDREG